jgi:hypothetical protein
MNIGNVANAAISEVSSWMYLPSKMIGMGAPCVFMLFGPKEWVDMILRSPKSPEILSPWVGIVFLYMVSVFLVLSSQANSFRIHMALQTLETTKKQQLLVSLK